MKNTFTLATVLFFFTFCSYGQKKEIMRSNLQIITSVKVHTDKHVVHSSNPINPKILQSKFLISKAKSSKPGELKSALTFKQRLDSIIEYTDANIPDYKTYLTYDSNGNNKQELVYSWDSNTSTWEEYKYDYTYDASRHNTQFISYLWDNDLITWIALSKYNFTYDANGQTTQILGYNWDINTANWIAYSKYNFSYDANRNNTQELDYNWDINANTWVENYRHDLTYDANGNISLKIDYNWDIGSNAWVANNKTEYTYNSGGKKTEELYTNWDSNTNSWIISSKYDVTYDGNGNMITERSYTWQNNIWNGGGKDNADYTYDANGNQNSGIYYDWDQATSQLIPSEKGEVTFDLAYDVSDLILPLYWYDEGIKNKLLEITFYEWDKVNSYWVNGYSEIYYYSDINITSVPKTVASGIDVYPNPVSEYFMVSGVSEPAILNMYNLQGKLILSKLLTFNERINISGLSKGVYFYNLTIDQKKHSGKLIKQ